MATHSSVLAWRIPGIREPGGLPSMGSYRVRHDLARSALAAAVAAVQCKRSWWFMADMKKGINNSACVWFHRRETLESES